MSLRADRGIEWFNTRSLGHLPAHLGIRITALSEGVATAELTVRPELMAPNGFLHAGSVVSLADTAAGFACIAHLPEGAENFTTLELKANLLGTARQGVVRAEARAVHLGKTTQVWDASCFAEGSERPIALFRCTQMILYPRPGAALSSPAAREPAGLPAVS
jgi:uncharacterized protein (TIGR00369 family)